MAKGCVSMQTASGSKAHPDRQFVWGLRYLDDLILRDRFETSSSSSSSSSESSLESSGSSDSSSSSGLPLDTTRLYALHDQWHVTAITDRYGRTVERYAYEA